ncbi:MAG: HAMP domain-containing histidine kinase [Thermoproteota archaeon]|nr:HAMP domain-containing histidine kinase [Thermoproteota archaeon]
MRETNESLRLATMEIKRKVEDLKRAKKDLTKTEQDLVIANDKLSESNHDLLIMNDQMIGVTKDLAMANEQIKQLALKQKEFIDVAAHELRTPAQAILGYSDMILSDPKTNLEYIKVIARNANRIQKLISNILDMAKIDDLTLRLCKEQFSLHDLISTVVQDFRNQIQFNKRNLVLIYDDTSVSNPTKENNNKNIIIEADKERIAQVLINLVDNAIKSTESGKIIITISTNVTNIHMNNPNYRREIIVKVKDSGKGLDPNLFSKVFLKFFIGPELGGGTGLGLYICKAIIEAHDGSIWVENNKDEKGATFSFSLPLRD